MKHTKDTYKITETNYKTGYEATWVYNAKTLSSAKRQASIKRVYTNTDLTIHKIHNNEITELVTWKCPEHKKWTDFGLKFYKNGKPYMNFTLTKHYWPEITDDYIMRIVNMRGKHEQKHN